MKVWIVYKMEDQLIKGTAQRLMQELREKGFKVTAQKPDFIISLGGDGTILRSAREFAGQGIPILGVHMGGVGFLSEIEPQNLNQALGKIKKGSYAIEERMMIEARVGQKKLTALNDLVMTKSGIARVIKFEVEGIANYIADGMIFSTATGSTAYNLAAGGPLLLPKVKHIILTAICPHDINNRSVIIDGPVKVRLTRGDEVILTSDGQKMLAVKVGQEIVVKRSNLKARFIRINPYNFFKRVKDTFGFGY